MYIGIMSLFSKFNLLTQMGEISKLTNVTCQIRDTVAICQFSDTGLYLNLFYLIKRLLYFNLFFVHDSSCTKKRVKKNF